MTKIAVSNLAWPAGEENEALSLLRLSGADAVEVAPTRIAPWADLDAIKLKEYSCRVRDAGLRVSSLQALYFGIDMAKLLGEDQDGFGVMLEHTRTVARVAESLGAQAMVYGAPNTRRLAGLDVSSAWDMAAERLRKLGDVVSQESSALYVIEPVPKAYGGEFLNRAVDVCQMVREVNHPSVAVHLDIACVHLAGDSIVEAIQMAGGRLGHFHFSEPNLRDLSHPSLDHAGALLALKQSGYQGWHSIEMLNCPDWRSAVTDAVGLLKSLND